MAVKDTRKTNQRKTGYGTGKKTAKTTILDDKRFRMLIIFVFLFLFFLKACNSIVDHKNNTYPGLEVPEEYQDYEASDLDSSGFFTDEYSFRSYNDGKTTSKRGIDVSEHQGAIDWEKVKAAGVEFAYIRLGYRTYDGGNIYLDSRYRENIEGALNNGIEVGVYFFSQAINVDEAIDEAVFTVDNIKGYDVSLPIAFDMEEVTGTLDRIADLSRDEITEISDAFCTIVENYDYDSIIYTNPYWAFYKLNLPRLLKRKLWLAHYSDESLFAYKCDIWQYSESGTIDGIGEKVDLNIMFVRDSEG